MEYRYVPKIHVPVGRGKELLREIFRNADPNNDQRLSKSELDEVFKCLGAIFPGHRAGRCLAQADNNGDGLIDKVELEDAITYAYNLGYTVK